MDTFGEYTIHCKELPEFIYRHEFVRDVLFHIFMCTWVSVKKETIVDFLTEPREGRSILRLEDILVYGWVGGNHVCVDLIGVFPLVGLRTRGFTM